MKFLVNWFDLCTDWSKAWRSRHIGWWRRCYSTFNRIISTASLVISRVPIETNDKVSWKGRSTAREHGKCSAAFSPNCLLWCQVYAEETIGIWGGDRTKKQCLSSFRACCWVELFYPLPLSRTGCSGWGYRQAADEISMDSVKQYSRELQGDCLILWNGEGKLRSSRIRVFFHPLWTQAGPGYRLSLLCAQMTSYSVSLKWIFFSGVQGLHQSCY